MSQVMRGRLGEDLPPFPGGTRRFNGEVKRNLPVISPLPCFWEPPRPKPPCFSAPRRARKLDKESDYHLTRLHKPQTLTELQRFPTDDSAEPVFIKRRDPRHRISPGFFYSVPIDFSVNAVFLDAYFNKNFSQCALLFYAFYSRALLTHQSFVYGGFDPDRSARPVT